MKKVYQALAIALALAVFAACDAAQAQRLINNLGSRLSGRGAAAELGEGEIIFDDPTIATGGQAVSNMPGTTVPVQQSAPAVQQGAPAAKAPVKKSDGSEFVISETATIDQLLAQANSLFETEIDFETEEEYSAWVTNMLVTVGKIGDRILMLKPNDEQFIQAITLKGQALCYQSSIDSAALPKLGAYASALEKNARVQSLDEGKQAAMAFRGVYLQAKVATIAEQNGTAAQLAAAMKEVNAFVKAHPETSDMYVDLVFPVQLIAETQKDPSIVAKTWTPIRKELAASDFEEAKIALQLLEGTIRYSELQGKPIKWHGVDASGKPLDTKKVEGKVVLISFWASWHEQCAEIDTHLKALYQKYHPLGFEIVGYNLDAEQANMDAYVKKNAIPWILLSDRAAADTKKTSLATYYGITEIPTMILVGGDGNVAALDIGMESLVATLEAVFAQPAAAAAKTTGKTVNPASKSNAQTTIKSSGARTSREQ